MEEICNKSGKISSLIYCKVKSKNVHCSCQKMHFIMRNTAKRVLNLWQNIPNYLNIALCILLEGK